MAKTPTLEAVAEEAQLPVPAPEPRLVVIQVDGDNFTVHNQGIEKVAVPTLLRIAAKRVEAELGL